MTDTVDDEDDIATPEGFCEDVEGYIQEQPLKAVAIAFLTGIVLGKLIL